LPTRDAVTEAVTAFVSLEAVSAVFLVKRDAKPPRHVGPCKGTGELGRQGISVSAAKLELRASGGVEQFISRYRHLHRDSAHFNNCKIVTTIN
jgi:hypothetical protein